LKERELVRSIKTGDHQAFEALYRMYADGALRTATAITSNRASAADAVQETFVRVYRNIHAYDEKQPFRPWFHTILMNECNRYLKKYANAIPVEIDEERDLPPDTDKYDFEERESLYALIQGLDDTFRIPIVLKYLNDLPDKEIADILNLNVNTVKSRLFKGKQKLKTWISEGKGDYVLE